MMNYPRKSEISSFIDRAMRENIPIEFWPASVIAAVVGIAAGLPFYPGGVELGADNKALGVVYGVCGAGINMALYAPFARQVIEWAIDNIRTPSELKPYVPTKFSKKNLATLVAVLSSFALASTIPYLALGEDTSSPDWIIAINIGANFIAHAKAFSIALGSENFMFNQFVTQNIMRLQKRVFSGRRAEQNYLEELKQTYILNDLHETALKNFNSVISSNHAKKPMLSALEGFARPEQRSTAYNVSRTLLAQFVTLLTFLSLSGYLAGGYDTMHNWTSSLLAGLLISAVANLFFLYLVGRSTFDTISTKVVDGTSEIWKNKSLQPMITETPWFETNKYKLGVVLTVCLVMAGLSFPSSVYLIQKNFPKIGIDNQTAINALSYITYGTAGIFNAVNIADLLKTLSQAIEFPRLKNNQEAQPLLTDAEAGVTELSAREKMKHDYLTGRIKTQLGRVEKQTLLQSISEIVSDSLTKDEIITNLTENKVTSAAEFDLYLTKNVTPRYYQSRAATFSGRMAQTIGNTLCCRSEQEDRPMMQPE